MNWELLSPPVASEGSAWGTALIQGDQLQWLPCCHPEFPAEVTTHFPKPAGGWWLFPPRTLQKCAGPAWFQRPANGSAGWKGLSPWSQRGLNEGGFRTPLQFLMLSLPSVQSTSFTTLGVLVPRASHSELNASLPQGLFLGNSPT